MILEILVFICSALFVFHLLNSLAWFISRNKKSVDVCAPEKGFSILIPCYNEASIIEAELNRLKTLNYSNYEVILVDDGSQDETFSILEGSLQLEETNLCHLRKINGCRTYRSLNTDYVTVVIKNNSGKGSSLNMAIEFAKYPLIVTLDADSYLAPNALKIMNGIFSDESVIAAGGVIHILQGGIREGRTLWQSILINLQILDYMKGFYIYKLSLSRQNAMAIISGAFGVFKKEYVQRVGGFRTTLGEDIDLTLKLQVLAKKEKKKIVYAPEALCYTQCPESATDLSRQRIRWQKGFVDCIKYFFPVLAKFSLSSSLSFHFYVEAFFLGIVSCVFRFSALFYLLFYFSREVLFIYIFYLALQIILKLTYGIISLYFAYRLHRFKPRMDFAFWLSVLLDLTLYGWYLIIIYLLGTIEYFWQGKSYYSWNKVKRNDII